MEMDGEEGYLAEKPATWTFRLRVASNPSQGLRPSARRGSRSRPAGLMVEMEKAFLVVFIGTFGLVDGKINICISRGCENFSQSFTQMHLRASSCSIFLCQKCEQIGRCKAAEARLLRFIVRTASRPTGYSSVAVVRMRNHDLKCPLLLPTRGPPPIPGFCYMAACIMWAGI